MTTNDVARALGVSGAAVKKWIKQGKLAAHRTPGGHFRVRTADFERFAAGYGFPVEGEAGPVVLVIDDDRATTTLLSRLLSEAAPDATVHASHDGYDGLVRIGALRPDLVLLDVAMPRIDGFEVCRQVRSDPSTRKTRIVVMSGREDAMATASALEAGADVFAAKGDDLGEVVAEARRLLRVAR
jgi:excisionase family DNA binding protein